MKPSKKYQRVVQEEVVEEAGEAEEADLNK